MIVRNLCSLQWVVLTLVLFAVAQTVLQAEQLRIGLPQTLQGLRGNKVAFSTDDRILAVGDTNGIITLWNTLTHHIIRTINTGIVSIRAMAFSPDGNYIVSSSLGLGYASGPPGQTYDSTIHVWNVKTGKINQILAGHTAVISSLVFSPRGKFLLSGSDDGTVGIWDTTVRHWKLSKKLLCGGSVYAVASAGNHVAVGGTKGAQIWDLVTGHKRKNLGGYWGSVYAVALSSDGKWFAVSGQDPTIHLWNLTTLAVSQSSNSRAYSVSFLTFSPDSKMLISGDATGCQIWNVSPLKSRRVLHTTSYQEHGPLIAITHDGGMMVTGNSSYAIQEWRIR